MINNTNADMVNISGGSYTGGRAAIVLNKSGRPGKPITYTAYPLDNERPVLDFSEYTSNAVLDATGNVTTYATQWSIGISMGEGSNAATPLQRRADWLILSGFDLTGMENYSSPPSRGANGYVIYLIAGSYNTLERLRMYENGGTGVFIPNYSICAYNLIKNCDSFNNRSLRNTAMNGNNDGFGAHLMYNSVGNVFYGCRAWVNGDDGFDLIHCRAPVVIDHCWAAYNGFGYQANVPYEDAIARFDVTRMDRLDNGLGIKAGGWNMSSSIPSAPAVYPRHVVRYSLAIGNPHSGISANHEYVVGNVYVNNTAYNNCVNFQMMHREETGSLNIIRNVNAYDIVMKNNISWPGPRAGNAANGIIDDVKWYPEWTTAQVSWLDIESGIIENNSWTMEDNGGKANHARDSFEARSTAYPPTPTSAEPTNKEEQYKDIVQNALGLTDADFVSLDEDLFLTPRKADGSLPDIDLVRPRSTSPAASIGYTAPDNNEDGYGDIWKMAGADPLL
jgi:hypothetical protein